MTETGVARSSNSSIKTTASSFIWEHADDIITKNNLAVTLMQQGQYVKAQASLRAALIKLQSQTRGSSIMMSASNTMNHHTDAASVASSASSSQSTSTTASSCSNSSSSSNTEGFDSLKSSLLDDWMRASTSLNRLLHHEPSEHSSFFLYREGISIPPRQSSHEHRDIVETYKAFAFCIFFNQGLSHHLNCKEFASARRGKQLASSAHTLYRIAMQYQYEARASSWFLLAVCNNLAVLDLQWSNHRSSGAAPAAPNAAAAGSGRGDTDSTGPYFAFQRKLLANSFIAKTISSSFTKKETALRNRYWANIHRAKDCFRLRSHAGAA